MLSLCCYHQKARKSRQNGFRDKTAYVWALDYRWRSFAIDDSQSRGHATYAALHRVMKVKVCVHLNGGRLTITPFSAPTASCHISKKGEGESRIFLRKWKWENNIFKQVKVCQYEWRETYYHSLFQKKVKVIKEYLKESESVFPSEQWVAYCHSHLCPHGLFSHSRLTCWAPGPAWFEGEEMLQMQMRESNIWRAAQNYDFICCVLTNLCDFCQKHLGSRGRLLFSITTG